MEMSRGDAAAAAWIFRGDQSRRRRGRGDAAAATTPRPRRGHSVEIPWLRFGRDRRTPRYRGFADAARGIWTADGAVGFYRGAAVRALAQAPSVAIVWTTYELLVRALAA